jgi:hypothetical protein
LLFRARANTRSGAPTSSAPESSAGCVESAKQDAP